jgi:L-ascorbate metabolism protein UlaG (beta-lactamase superfamily)
MKKPFRQDDAFLADVESTRDVHDDSFRLWWLGQSGFLLQWHRRHVLFDPYLSDSLTLKYEGTDKPHIRITERVIDPARLAFFVDAATSSHNHTDHLDADTLRPIIRQKTLAHQDLSLVVSPANETFAYQRLGSDVASIVALNVGESWRAVTKMEFTAVPAAHPDLATDENGDPLYIGLVVKFGRWTVYHSGDTKLYDGMVEILRPFKIDVALLPINGDRPERRVAGNLDGREAAGLAKAIGARLVIPCHYDMFEFNTADPADEFIPECERLGQAYRILRQGERLDSTEVPR